MLILRLAESSSERSNHCTDAVCWASATSTIKWRAMPQHLLGGREGGREANKYIGTAHTKQSMRQRGVVLHLYCSGTTTIQTVKKIFLGGEGCLIG